MFALGVILLIVGLILLFTQWRELAPIFIGLGVLLILLDIFVVTAGTHCCAVAIPARMLLSNVNIKALSLVEKGANRNRWLLFKSGEDPGDVVITQPNEIVKQAGQGKDPWSVAYVVVASPDAEEDPGLYGDQDTIDVWASEDEIRKAAHQFMRNGALVNKMHEDLEPFGQLVENAVALADITIDTPDGPQTIRKGSWYVGIEPTPDGREAIDKGEFTGVSVQGTGQRTPAGELVKSAQDYIEDTWIEKDAVLVPDKPGARNWIDRTGTGNLPKFIGDIAGDLITEKGKSTGEAIQLAVGIVRNWCEGKGNVSAATRAKACAAAAEWEAKKGQAHVQKSDDCGCGDGVQLDQDESLFMRLAKRFGLLDQDWDPVIKRSFTESKRQELAAKDHAMPHGGFPIENCKDVENAVNAIGRAKDPGATKRFIVKRAKALGCTDKVPSDWQALAKEAGTVEDVDEAQVTELIEKATGPIGERVDELAKAVDPLKALDTDALAKLPDTLENLSKRLPEPKENEPSREELEKQRDEAIDGAVKQIKELDEKIEKLAAGDSTQNPDDIQKSGEREPSWEADLLS